MYGNRDDYNASQMRSVYFTPNAFRPDRFGSPLKTRNNEFTPRRSTTVLGAPNFFRNFYRQQYGGKTWKRTRVLTYVKAFDANRSGKRYAGNKNTGRVDYVLVLKFGNDWLDICWCPVVSFGWEK